MQNQAMQKGQAFSFSTVILVLLATFCLFILLNYTNSLIDDLAFDSLGDTSENLIVEIYSELNAAKSYTLSLAHSTSDFVTDEETLFTFLREQNSYFDFHDIYFFDLEGNGKSIHGGETSLCGEFLSGETPPNYVYMSTTYNSTRTNEEVINIQTPVYVNNEPVGYLLTEYSMSYITERLTQEISLGSYVVLTDSDGVDFYSTDDNFIPLHELENALISNGVTVDTIVSDLNEQKAGIVSFSLDSIPRLVVYTPLGINEWTFVLVAKENEIEQNTRLLTTIIIVFVFIVFIGLFLFSLYTWKVRKKIEDVAYYDELTGLPNLTMYKKVVSETLKNNPNGQYAAVKMDVENFKAINEIFNFDVGNKVLRAFASTAATVDEKTYILARTGADEFMMFSGNGLLHKLESLTPHYEAYFKESVSELKNYHITFNYGRYCIQPGETDANEIVQKVGIAHNISKIKQDHNVWDYDNNYKNQIKKHAEISNKMRKAMVSDEFVPFLQPKVRLSNGEIIGAEALVRWIESDRKMVFPDVFIPLFESNGFIVELDKHILKKVCIAISSWIEAGYEPLPVSVNFSRLHLSNPDFVDNIVAIIDRYNVPHELIEVELTETTIIDNNNEFTNVLEKLHANSLKVSIDDFGAGYSSLGMLKNFTVDTLKLDRSFLINNDLRGNSVIEGIVKLAHSIKMNIVAEGVEEIEQVEFLKSLSCEYAQGYYYAKPMPIEEFNEKYFNK